MADHSVRHANTNPSLDPFDRGSLDLTIDSELRAYASQIQSRMKVASDGLTSCVWLSQATQRDPKTVRRV